MTKPLFHKGSRRPCPADGCPGLELYDGKPDGCGHPTKTSGCAVAERDPLWEHIATLLAEAHALAEAGRLWEAVERASIAYEDYIEAGR